MKVICIKYGELSTKKDNINYFLKLLKKDIESKLKDINIKYDYGRMYIEINNDNYDYYINKLKNIFGIHEIVLAHVINDKDINNIKDTLLNIVKDKSFNTFKIETKRSDKSYNLNSLEISRILGSHILKNIDDIKVDVNNPDLLINVEIRKNNVLLYTDRYKGMGGYPLGSVGSGLVLLSGGIDSPVAAYLAMKRGIKVDAIYFESPPHTSENALNKVISLSKIISEYGNNIRLHVINFTEIQEEIYKNIPHDYLVTIMRRMMYRISERLADILKYDVLINGESIGQVASQTLKSMKVINEVVSIPVIRPVACLDKLEIIDISKKIGTYETSILPYEDCCTIFVPKHPVINPTLQKCLEYESLINYDSLIDKCIQNRKVIKTNVDIYKDLL